MEKEKLTAKLGYAGAGVTVLAAVLAPFLLFGLFTKGFSSLGLHVDEMYSGGPEVRTIQAAGYIIEIHRQVSPHMLQREKPFVQLDWKPASGLPSHISDLVDIDGDGKPDIRADFNVPKDPKALLHVEVESLKPHYEQMQNVKKEKFSALIVRVDDKILVRVPVKR
jgi:hypothetical protein